MSTDDQLTPAERDLLERFAVGDLSPEDPEFQAAHAGPVFRKILEDTQRTRAALELTGNEVRDIVAAAAASTGDAPGAEQARRALEEHRRNAQPTGLRGVAPWAKVLAAAAVILVLGYSASRATRPPQSDPAGTGGGVAALSGLEDEIRLIAPVQGTNESIQIFEIAAPEGMDLVVHLRARRRSATGWTDLPPAEPVLLGQRRSFDLAEVPEWDGPVDWVRWSATGTIGNRSVESGSRVSERSSR